MTKKCIFWAVVKNYSQTTLSEKGSEEVFCFLYATANNMLVRKIIWKTYSPINGKSYDFRFIFYGSFLKQWANKFELLGTWGVYVQYKTI